MPKSSVASQHQFIIGECHHIFVDIILMFDDGTNLEPVNTPHELAVGTYVAGKLYLHRTLHSLLSARKHEIAHLGQWENVVAQDVGECNHFASGA